MKYVYGDLLSEEALKNAVIAHGCNTRGNMGAGIAKLIREKFPECYQTYNSACTKRQVRLGEVLYWSSGSDADRVIIANAMTQIDTNPRQRQVNYMGLGMAMTEIIADANVEWGGLTVRLPLIGAGLGGGSWDIIAEIIRDIEKMLSPRNEVEVYVFERDKYDILSTGGSIG